MHSFNPLLKRKHKALGDESETTQSTDDESQCTSDEESDTTQSSDECASDEESTYYSMNEEIV